MSNDGTPLLITVGNWGYRDLIMSWWLNVRHYTPELLDRVRVVVWEDQLEKYFNKHLPLMKIVRVTYNQGKNFRNSVSFKHKGWDVVTRFKLQAIHNFIYEGQSVLYLDPDVVLLKNVFPYFESLPQNKVYIQQGKPYCSGVLYVTPCDAAKAAFDISSWRDWQSDDEKYLINFFKCPRDKSAKDWSQHICTLDLNEYPNGLFEEKMWTKPTHDVKNRLLQKARLIHFNYISGLDKKCSTIKRFGYLRKPLMVVDVPAHFQPILGEVCMRKRNSKYPAHQDGYQIETYFDKYLHRQLREIVIESEYDYLPLYWTAIAVENDSKLRAKTKDWVKNFIDHNPDRKFFTVVQHCKGVEGTLNIILPKEWKIFSTSDPNAAKDIMETIAKDVLIPATPSHLPVGKMKLLRNPQPLIGHGREQAMSLNQVNKLHSTIDNLKGVDSVHLRRKMFKARHNRFDVSNHTTIPLLCSPHLSAPIRSHGPRKILASFVGNLNIHSTRKSMSKILSNIPDIVIKDGKYLSEDDVRTFEDLMKSSTFALCPRGFGNTSFRLVEAIEYGAIPVYISDVYSLPFEDDIDWNKCCIRVPPSQLGNLRKVLLDILNTENRLQEMQSYMYDVYNEYFTYEKCSDKIISMIQIK